MSDEPDLRELLRRVPADGASPGFRARVMRRVATEGRPRRGRPAARLGGWLVLATSLAAVAVGGWLGLVGARRPAAGGPADLERETAALAREIQELERELEQQPVVYLGGTEEMDFVIDLARFR